MTKTAASFARLAGAVVAAALVLTACESAGPDPQPETTTTAGAAVTSGTPPVADDAVTTTEGSAEATAEALELNTAVPMTVPVERTWPEEIETISEGEREFTLFGVHRLDDSRAVVTGRVAGSTSDTSAAQWFEPGFFFASGGYEFSRVAVVDQEGVRHLPVRDEDDRCLCSVSTKVYTELGDEGGAPAWAVVSLPAGQDRVDVEVADVGTIQDVPVTELPQASSVPFGWNEVLTIDQVSREGGVVTARTTMANAGDFRPTYTLARHQFDFPDLQGQHCFQGLAAYGPVAPTGRMAKDTDCHTGSMVEPGEQITLEVKVADPGGEHLVVLPDAGLPVTTPAVGTASVGAAESLRTYASRAEEAGASVEQGDEVTVSLDTAVLFDFDKAKLTGKADDAIAVAVEVLREQDSRAVAVAGHTDGQGSAARNDELSEQRAEAVARALEEELGSGWDITVEWHGSSRPVADETGTEEQVEAAQARNRRVEITVR
ncbi:OmpA family protein [Ornithinimicrobium avium]|uniref:OmpA family protein n=1 Tax=Ornithinimicrobium avium TaxID=2283195 RepID=A0A345NPH0_9MICO|nr:OmpA family protein [Ornithinimicrobium avium]AXH96928.1 OmpA family protein [Ornithinimicrobium avium]